MYRQLQMLHTRTDKASIQFLRTKFISDLTVVFLYFYAYLLPWFSWAFVRDIIILMLYFVRFVAYLTLGYMYFPHLLYTSDPTPPLGLYTGHRPFVKLLKDFFACAPRHISAK